MVKLVQVGLGGWGRDWVAEVLPKVPGVEMVGFVDADPAMRAIAAKRLGLDEAVLFGSLEDAVAEAKRLDKTTGREVESANKYRAIYILGQVYHSLGEAAKAIAEAVRR